MRRDSLLQPAAVREKKKLAARRFAFWHSSAIECAMADLPPPAGP